MAFATIMIPRIYETGRKKFLPAKTRGDKLKSISTPRLRPPIHTGKLNIGNGTHAYESRNDCTIELYSGRKPVSASSKTCNASASARKTQALPHLLVGFCIEILGINCLQPVSDIST